MSSAPRITIVTPSFQQATTLEETIDSVLSQDYPDLEYIVIDGGSEDGSVDIIKQYEKHLTYWESVADRGQSHAINKGLQRSTGQVFNWLNSDDLLAPNALKTVGQAFAENPELDCFGGMLNHLEGKVSTLFDKLNDASNPRQLFCDPVINQMATFYRGDLARNLKVNERLHYAMDYGLWLSVLFAQGTKNLRFERIQLAEFRLHDDQKTHEGFDPFVVDIARLLADLAAKAQELELAQLLAIGHGFKTDLESSISVAPAQYGMVRDMVAYFLLKWHYRIYSAEKLEMMKRFVHWVERTGFRVHKDQQVRYSEIVQQCKASNWFTFRVLRKLKSLSR